MAPRILNLSNRSLTRIVIYATLTVFVSSPSFSSILHVHSLAARYLAVAATDKVRASAFSQPSERITKVILPLPGNSSYKAKTCREFERARESMKNGGKSANGDEGEKERERETNEVKKSRQSPREIVGFVGPEVRLRLRARVERRDNWERLETISKFQRDEAYRSSTPLPFLGQFLSYRVLGEHTTITRTILLRQSTLSRPLGTRSRRAMHRNMHPQDEGFG